MEEIREFTSQYDEYRHDESRSAGRADTISFPESEEEVCRILKKLYPEKIPVTVQGGRTGLAAGAVPAGGHVMNLSRMNRILGIRRQGDTYRLRLQPGVILSVLRKTLESRRYETSGWQPEDQQAWQEFCGGAACFFPTDPTETSACLGGMAACNASGARSFRYGPMRAHVCGLHAVLADGSLLVLSRGTVRAEAGEMRLRTEDGRLKVLQVPSYRMPHTKNASGYYAAPDMDAVDLFIGSDGTLGVITELTLELLREPKVIWGVSCFFTGRMGGEETEEAAGEQEEGRRDRFGKSASEAAAAEAQAAAFTEKVRDEVPEAAALEYFDEDSLRILRQQKLSGSAFSALPDVSPGQRCCLYAELQADTEEEALAALYHLGDILRSTGGSEQHTWVARTDTDRASQQFFRHAVPESVNMLIDARKKTDPVITKLAADMSVPDGCLMEILPVYRRDLQAAGLESAIWGHIGNNHLHVNILPRNAADYRKGIEVIRGWAAAVTAMGGAVSAEHGIGKLKRDFLLIMMGQNAMEEMISVKRALDPDWLLGRGNLFSLSLPGVPEAVKAAVEGTPAEGRSPEGETGEEAGQKGGQGR